MHSSLVVNQANTHLWFHSMKYLGEIQSTSPGEDVSSHLIFVAT